MEISMEMLSIFSNAVAVFLSPLIAWFITVKYQERKQKRQEKSDLFLTLMSNRKKYPPSIEWVDALNQIDIVFQDNNKVRICWKEYLSSLNPKSPHYESSNSYLLDLLSEMATDLGYKNLKQTEIDKFYFPAYFGNLKNAQDNMATEWYRVLFNSKSMAEGLTDEQIQEKIKAGGDEDK